MQQRLKTALPFFFGKPEKRLFGCFHEPNFAHRRECAVVICQPVGHEYVNSHRALRQLAVNLAGAGFPVLRFDYYACGDSAGNAFEGSIGHWVDDIAIAIAEVRRRTGLSQVSLVGLRLGGALALIAGTQSADLESLILWDPVFEGRNYLEQLTELHREMLRFRPRLWPERKSQDYIELLGFPLSGFLYSELQKLDLSMTSRKPAKNTLILRTGPITSEEHLAHCLARIETHVECRHLDAPQVWLPTTNGSLLVPRQPLQAVVSWASRMHS